MGLGEHSWLTYWSDGNDTRRHLFQPHIAKAVETTLTAFTKRSGSLLPPIGRACSVWPMHCKRASICPTPTSSNS